MPREGRAIWVTRGHYRSADDVRAIMENCAATGFNDVLFQVRGNATVFYKSAIEPWAYELSPGRNPENLGVDPGWDPLAVAVEEAHKRGLNLHAWVNVYPGWQGGDWPPADKPHVWNTHPEWFMRDKNGDLMLPYYMNNQGRKTVWYSFLNPAVPAVNDYLMDVFTELVANYDVDGLHLDYIRYPHDLAGWDFSYDEVSLKRFADESGGKTPDDAPEAWDDWRAAQVTGLVARLHKRLHEDYPGVMLTVAVAGNYEHGRHNKQYRRDWTRDGIVDGLILMNYNADTNAYLERVRDEMQGSPGAVIYSGMGPYRIASADNPEEVFRAQVRGTREAGAAGTAQFSYTSLFENHKPKPFADILRTEFYTQPAASPLWK